MRQYPEPSVREGTKVRTISVGPASSALSRRGRRDDSGRVASRDGARLKARKWS
jgi:hypothetical protein